MAITDLTGTSWHLADSYTYYGISFGGKEAVNNHSDAPNNSDFNSTNGYWLKCKYEGEVYEGYVIPFYDYDGVGNGGLWIGGGTSPATQLIKSNTFYHPTYEQRTLRIVGGTDATNTTLINSLTSSSDWRQINTVSVDLTTLAGWSALAAKTYDIQIVAKADGYRDSAPSAAVQVEKAAAYTDCITFTGETSDFTLTARYKEWDGTVEYSTDHNTWTTWNGAAVSSVNKKLYLRGSGNTKFYASNGTRLSLSARAACSGNIQTLLEYSNPPTSIPAKFCYWYMFSGCTGLTQAPELPATTLSESCYFGMFNGCTSLIQAPELPATTVSSYGYQNMFKDCTSLTQAPELPATTLYSHCYHGMFSGCTGLTQAPELPATTFASNSCYDSMFLNCTGLKQAPALPATTLSDYCYENMFSGCTGLTQAPELPATTLRGSCYRNMFKDCTSLTQAPELPAKTLKNECYAMMFNGCTGLKQAPSLPATTLSDYCYSNMFNGCSSLKISGTQSSEYTAVWRIPSSGTISSSPRGWKNDMLTGTGGTFTSDPSINTTYYGAW